MYGKLVHRPPCGHHCHGHRPPFEEHKELCECHLGRPELTDYWIKPYLLQALKHYPKLDDECVVQGLWTFANSILLKNYKAAKRVPPTFDDPEVTHKIAFLDREDVELGAIKFWRKVDSTFGIDVKLGNGGISIVCDNDNPTMSLVNTPVNGSPKEIVNVEYLNQAFSAFNNGLNALANRVTVLEDLYNNRVKPVITDPNGNTRGVHTTIHADGSDANLPTCGAVYQYGKGISDALNSRIDTTNSRIDTINNKIIDPVDAVQDGNMHPVTSNAVADEIADIRAKLNDLGSSSGGGSGGSGSDGGSSGSSSSGSVETGGTYEGWRIWRNGSLAAIHIPAGVITAYNQEIAKVELPFQVDSIIYHNHPSTGHTGGNSTWTLSINTDSNYLEFKYTGGGLSPGQSVNYEFDLICWIK